MHRFVLLAAVASLAAGSAGAQVAPERFRIGTHLGYTNFAAGTALRGSPFLGFDAVYHRVLGGAGGGTDVGVGLTFTVSRPVTRGDQFPAVLFPFGDSLLLYEVSQRITMLQYGLQAVAGQALGPVRLYALGGGGAYTIVLDARQNLGTESFAKGMLLAGGGLDWSAGRGLGVRLEARDFILLGFDRDRLDPTIGYTQDRRIRDVLPPPDPTAETLHNLQLSLVFSYVPGRVVTTGEER